MENTTPTIRQWNEEIFQLLYQYYQGVSNMSNSGTFNIKGVLEYIRKILFNKKFNIPNEDAMKSSVLEGMTTFKQDSYNAFKAFKDSIEMYIEIAMYSIQLLDKKEIVSNSLSIGKCNKRLLEALQERCRLSENEIRKLGYFIEEGETWRNIWHHNTPPREDTDIHKKGCQIALEYLFAVSAICRRIEMARGGIRFTADITCSLDFQNGGQNRSFTYVDVNTPLQIEGKAGEYTLRITINDKDGAKTFTREGVIKSNQYNNEVLQKDSRTHKKNKIRIAPIFNLGNDALDGIPWKRGNYQGAVDSEGQPHGIGTYIQEEKKFGGRFQHGEPQGVFKVSCSEFEYKGTIVANNNSLWDLCEGEMEMSNSKELKFIGRFKNFCCVEGKLLIANKISYEGTFKIINGQATVSGYGTLYLPDHLIYRGEVFNGAPHGRGCLVDEQALEVTYTDWYMGESIADELKELYIKGNTPAKLYDKEFYLCQISAKGVYFIYSISDIKLKVLNQDCFCEPTTNDLQKRNWNYNLSCSLIKTKKKGKLGYFNKEGKNIIPCVYDDIFTYGLYKCGIARAIKENKHGIINRMGNVVVPFIYDEIGVLIGLKKYTYIKKGEKWGIIDKKGRVIISPEWEGIKEYKIFDGFPVKKQGKWGIVNNNGNIIIPFLYDGIKGEIPKHDSNAACVIIDNKCGVINDTNSFIIEPKWDDIQIHNEANIIFVKKKGKWGVININNEEILDTIFDYLCFSKNVIIVRIGSMYGCVNLKGQIIIDPIIKSIYDITPLNSSLIKVKIGEKYGCVNSNGEFVLKPIYDKIWFDENVITVKYSIEEKGYYYLYDTSGNLISSKFEYIGLFNKGFAYFISTDNQYGFVDKKAKAYIIERDRFKEISSGINDLTSVQNKDNKWGFINHLGNIIIPCTYDYVRTEFNNMGLAEVVSEDEIYIIDKTGKIELIIVDNDYMSTNRIQIPEIKSYLSNRVNSFNYIERMIDFDLTERYSFEWINKYVL